MVADLGPDEFRDFFAQVHGGHAPFPWQAALLEQVLSTRTWPDVIDVPTGAGKTALIDVAVFALACAAQQGGPIWTPRRIIMVVDRRVVVDQAGEHSRHLARLLAEAESGPTERVAAALLTLSEGERPLLATVLRGGTVTDDSWTRRPDQPAVLASTVDQVGSRMLFRGYGVSRGMRPVHAGLLSSDCLFLLDEVHLSQPFSQTLSAVADYRSWNRDGSWIPPFGVVSLSATPGSTSGSVFTLGPDDHDEATAPALVRRLTAPKPARLHKVKTPASDSDADRAFAVACADAAQKLVHEKDHVRKVAVVVNRVVTARRVAGELEAIGSPTVLLTGRMRGLDRDHILRQHRDSVIAGRSRSADDQILFVVATQSIEAGADFDFDAMVTECAPLDSLRQRFGRLDRLGALSAAGTPAIGVILVRSSDLGSKASDPVYGTALAETWRWLEGRSSVDFGIGQVEAPEGDALTPLMAPRADAPVLLPKHLDLLAQTRPAPSVEPDVALFLHGPQPVDLDVNVVWRSDVSRALLEAAATDTDAAATLVQIVAACPPAPVESLSVPISAVRAWLVGAEPAPTFDVDGHPITATTADEESRNVLRWSGDESEVVDARHIRPGDTIVVPATYGGLTMGNWDPESQERVTDLGDRAQSVQRGVAVLRLHPEVHGDVPVPPHPPSADEDPVDPYTEISAWLGTIESAASAGSDAEVISHLRSAVAARGRRSVIVEMDPGPWGDPYWVVQARRPLPTESLDGPFDPEASAFTAVEVSLDDHLAGVGDWAAGFARRCGVPTAWVEDLHLAGRLHDLGKADPRFQRMLLGGDPVSYAAADRLLAKSAIPSQDAAARAEAARRSGYPRGTRHELLSLALIDSNDEVAALAHDWDLVRHLVASHHGWCRPLPPVAPDPTPLEVTVDWQEHELTACSAHGLERLDSGVGDRYWRLTKRYGWFGLAWLETILRLADHRRSEQEAARG